VFLQKLEGMGISFARLVASDEWRWITNRRIRPAFVVRMAVKWGLILTLGSLWLTFAWVNDPTLAGVTMGMFLAGLMFYFMVDTIAGAMLEDDPILLREDKAQ